MADQITTSLAQAKVLVMEGQKGADGKSPYIGANGNWFVWNGTAWVDTGIPASLDDAQIAAAVEEYLEEHPVEITVDDALSDTSENPVQNKVVNAALNQKGTYTKPSGGIPKSDLATDVQTSLGKADSAYQKPSTGIPASDLEQAVQDELDAIEPFEITITQSGQTYSFSATAAEIAANADNCVLIFGDNTYKPSYVEHGSTWTRIYWIDGTTTLTIYELSTNGTNTILVASYAVTDPNLPTVSSTDNGKFLRVVSGAWAAQAVPFQTPRVAMTSADTTPTLDPNKLYVFPEMATLTPTLATPTDNAIVNEYHFVFDSGSTATVLTLPASVLQPDGFTVEANMHYEISILEGAMTAQGWAVTA